MYLSVWRKIRKPFGRSLMRSYFNFEMWKKITSPGNPRSEIIKLLSRISSYRRRKTIRKEGSIEDRAE